MRVLVVLSLIACGGDQPSGSAQDLDPSPADSISDAGAISWDLNLPTGCGGYMQPCCDYGVVPYGCYQQVEALICTNGTCTPCGGLQQPCCLGEQCPAKELCISAALPFKTCGVCSAHDGGAGWLCETSGPGLPVSYFDCATDGSCVPCGSDAGATCY